MLLIVLLVFGACVYGSTATQIRAVDSGLCLNVQMASMTRGANIITWDCNESYANNQFEWLQPQGNAVGSQIRATQSGLCLNVDHAATGHGANVITWDCGNYPNNQFQWITVGGYKQIQAIQSGLCLNVWMGSKTRGANIITWECGDFPNNRFEMVGVTNAAPPPPPAGDCPFRVMAVDFGYQVMDGYDVSPGRSIAVRTSSSFEKCGTNCATCEGCVAFVFNSAQGQCYLKDNRNIVESAVADVTAGIFTA